MLEPGSVTSVSVTTAYVLADPPRPGRSLLRSENIILFVDTLYSEVMEAVKSLVALSSPPGLIWILGEINFVVRDSDHFQSVNLSTGSKRSLVLI
jgi:hypothetical protein